MPTRTPAGIRFTCKHELGCVTADSFLIFWRSFRDAYKDGIKKTVRFPFEWLESPLCGIVDFFYEITWRGIFNMGIMIGDKSYDMIFGRAEEEIKKIEGLIDETKRKIERELINPLKAKIAPIERQVNDVVNRIKDAESRVSGFQDGLDGAFDRLKEHTDYIEGLETRANKLAYSMDYASKRLKEYKSYIDQLFERVENLERGRLPEAEKKDLLTYIRRELGI